MIVLQGKSACQVQRFIILKISNMEIRDMAESEIPRDFLGLARVGRPGPGSLRAPERLTARFAGPPSLAHPGGRIE